MNTSAFSRIAITFAVMILALWISLDVFASGSNAFGKFYFYMMIGAFLLGLISPRRGFFFLLFCAGYLDYFKRLMILDAGLRQLDLYYVLGIAPAALAGMSITVLYQLATANHRRPNEGLITCACIVIVLILGMVGFLSRGDATRSLGDLVNAIVYINMVFVTPALFRTPEDLRHALKTSIIIFIPSIIYYIYQSYAGFTWWEYKYLLSGLTIEIRQLGERVVRVFGTMNGAGAATIVYSLSAVLLVFSRVWKYKDSKGRLSTSSLIGRVLLSMVFAYAAWRTFSRAGWFVAAFAAFCFYAFQSRILTKTFYLTLFGALGAVMIFSGFIVKNDLLNRWSEVLLGKGGDEMAQATQLGSMNARLEGFHVLTTDAKVWTPLGVHFAGSSEDKVLGTRMVHDAFTLALLKYGYIPMLFICLFFFLLIRSLHRFVYVLPQGLERDLVVTCLGCFVSLLSGVVVNGAALVNYPINFFIYFYLGVVVAVKLYHDEQARYEQPEDIRLPVRNQPRSLPPGGNRMPPGGNRIPPSRQRPLAVHRENYRIPSRGNAQ